MGSDIMFNFKELFDKKEEKNNANRKIENLVFFALILIFTVIIINFTWNSKTSVKKNNTDSSEKYFATNDNSEEKKENIVNSDLEKRMEDILKTIDGVGDVHVLINYSASSSIVTVYNENTTKSTTEEEDKTGGTRKIDQVNTQKEIAYTEENGEKTPITEKVIMPTIEGAIITAKGASDANIKSKIIAAVEAITGLSTHKIQVFEMGL